MNEHSPKFERVKMWYDTMRWTKEMVANAVTHPPTSPWITSEEYAEIKEWSRYWTPELRDWKRKPRVVHI